MNADSERFLEHVGDILPPRNPLHDTPDDEASLLVRVRRIVRDATRTPSTEATVPLWQFEQALRDLAAARRQVEQTNRAYVDLLAAKAAETARLEHERDQARDLLTRRPHLSAWSLRWLRLGRWLHLT